LPLDAHAEHHFRRDRKQQQAARDAEGGQPIESVRSSLSPINAAPARITAAIRQARNATARRDRLGRPWVTATNVGTRPSGSTTTTIVTSAEIRNSSGMGFA
jgi:hypothetical protein